MTITCSNCGEDNPERARFCLACGESLEPATRTAEERKVVSVLFVDLVGFTAASDASDPEDVRARLRPYHARLKREIERFGGTVEKFVGDAVMAVFGAPVAHEDDAERAVRAALAVLDAIDELNAGDPDLGLAVRAAVNTGEAVVALGARPELGEGLVTGDVVNVASRLQGEASPGTIVVGEQTHRLTRAVIELEQLEPVSVKGKAGSIPLWRAVGARSRLGVDLAVTGAPLVGREEELAVLRQTFARAVRDPSTQLVTIVGEPGIGKSRLVAELRSWVDELPEIVLWRQGRCLPYGEGITFWALAEIVKAHAGILDSDAAGAAREKLGGAVAAVVAAEDDRRWIAAELAPLVGADVSAGGSGREQSFTAWRAFLEALAVTHPLVLVFEDVHWADAALLAFVEELADWSSGVPLVLVCTARPELFELHPAWGGGKRNATTLSLSPLDRAETARLLGALLGGTLLRAEQQQALLERAAGNPLYAEQFARMLEERPDSDELPVPESIQALIAARLDTLPPERKSTLQDAAVVGKVFWAGVVASLGGREAEHVRLALHELGRHELVRPARRSSVEGQAEFSFWHVLVRDVAYAQIPRRERARKHAAAARWIEEITGDRVGDHAELVAHHYREALEWSLAAGAHDEARALEEPARRALVLAGERSARLDPRRAGDYYDRALALLEPADPERGRILLAAGEAAFDAGDPGARAALEQAVAALRSSGDRELLGHALTRLSHVVWAGGEWAASEELRVEGLSILEALPAGRHLAEAHALAAGKHALAGFAQEALESAAKAIEAARPLGLEAVVQRAMQFRGLAKGVLGDHAGAQRELEDALELARELDLLAPTAVTLINLASWDWYIFGATRALERYREAIEFAERRGLGAATWALAESTFILFDLGRWDEVVETTRRIVASGHGDATAVSTASRVPFVLVYRGRLDEALGELDELLRRARAASDPQFVYPALAAGAVVRDAAGDGDSALALAAEVADAHDIDSYLYPDVARVCVRHGAFELAERLASPAEHLPPRAHHTAATIRALVAEARGGREEAARLYAEAVTRWTEHPFVLERAQCLVGLARCTGDVAAAEEARSLFRSLGAGALEREADALVRLASPRSA